MDINKLEAEVESDEQGAVVPIFKKNHEPYTAADGSQSTLTVTGSDSAKVRAAKDSAQRRIFRARAGRIEPADVRRNRVDVAAAAIIGWHGWENGGTEAPCTSENVKALLNRDHILEQAERAIDAHSDFFESSSSS
jgi:hypothetical protein